MENLTPSYTPKSFFKRPEGKFGLVLGAVLVYPVIVVLNRVLPMLVNITWNLVNLTIAGAVLFALWIVITDKRVWALGWYMYRSACRAITGWFIELDPIGILKSYVQDLHRKKERIEEQLEKLKGVMRALREEIENNEKLRQRSIALAGQAQKQKDAIQFRLKARKAGRLEESNVDLMTLDKKLETVYRVLVKYYEAAKYYIEDIEDMVNVMTRKRKAITAAYSAFRSAMSILRGEADKRAIFDETVERMAEDYGMKLGEIEGFIDLSSEFIGSIDLEQGVFEDRVLRQLETWERQADSLIMAGDEKKLLVAKANDDSEVLDLDVPVREAVPVSAKPSRGRHFRDLFEDK